MKQGEEWPGLILVTGANGFVGKALCGALGMRDAPVRAALRSLPPSQVGRQGTCAVGEISESTDWKTALSGVAAVVHLAARVHVMVDHTHDPLEEYRRVNVHGTLRLARQAALAGVKRFIFISSIKVNGEATEIGHPYLPESEPAPLDAYGVSKAEAEKALMQLALQTGMEIVVIRPPLVYGPGVRANFGSILNWVRRGIPLPLGSITLNRRSLVALDNLVDLIATCIRHPKAANQIFLVSDGEDVSTTQLLQCMGQALGRQIWLLPMPPSVINFAAALIGKRAMAQRLLGSLQADISKTRQLLGWNPSISLSEGLRRAMQE